MIQIAIVDDEPQFHENIKSCLDYMTEKEGIEFGVTSFYSGRAFTGNYKPIYDIVLMDIKMPDENGLDTARMLRRMDTSVILIFVTSMAHLAIQGYEVEALDFIVKPLNKYEFAMKMNRAVRRTNRRMDDMVQIRTEGDIYTISASSIKYLDVSGHYVVYHTVDGDYRQYITLKKAESKIGKKYFVYCNRYLLVNLQYVEAIKQDCVIVKGEKLLFSRTQKKHFISAYSDFLGGNQ